MKQSSKLAGRFGTWRIYLQRQNGIDGQLFFRIIVPIISFNWRQSCQTPFYANGWKDSGLSLTLVV